MLNADAARTQSRSRERDGHRQSTMATATELRSRIGVATRWNRPDEADEARRELHYLTTAQSIADYVNSRPAPSAEDLAKLRNLLQIEA
jgi:hypothetical protein